MRGLLIGGTYSEVVRKDLGMVGEAFWLQLGESEVKSREKRLRSYFW